ncbi:CBS domain-containing membrane protein [Parvibaculum indicum]|uniref:HPP family protein n=1 Tax=Parvibaculum indicum TaxID=562969 RepID=UPI001423C0B5|nr:HPP family protein [Parvibaculum indicum]NIJ40017.1 CBS domain-containing membrane protein [Parvibaculum indicum]
MTKALRHLMRALGPAVAAASLRESVRAGFGAVLGLGLVGLLVLAPTVDLQLGLYLIAPFGATSVLIFAVPNSPLAQPWSAIVGNTLAAVVGVAVCLTVRDPALRIALAVGSAITLMSLARAVHPPAGAVAMTAAMSPDAIHELGFRFALAPVAAGTTLLVLVAWIYARTTGRRYPFRQFEETNSQGTYDPPPAERLGLSEAELTDILQRYRQSLNLGVEDLARLIGAAELQAASHQTAPLAAADIMSHELITVARDTPLIEIAELFKRHRFTSLPVVGPNAEFLGVIFQMHLIARARDDARYFGGGFLSALKGLLNRGRDKPVYAGDVMNVTGPRAAVTTSLGDLLPMMADGEVDAVPVLRDERIVGIVTRTDVIAAMARHVARNQ